MRPALRALAVALAALALACSCSSSEERAARRVARAEQLVLEQRGDEALLELESALAIDPRSAAVNQRIGELLADRGATAAAAAHFEETYRLDPSQIEAALRAATLFAADEPARAQRILESVLETHPETPAVHRTAATLAIARGDLASALAFARAAIALDRTRRDSWLQLGAVERARAADLLAHGAPAEPALASALDAYREAEALAGGDVTARVETARMLASWPARRSEAAASFRSAIALAAERGDADERYAAASALEQFARGAQDAPLALEALRHEVNARPGQLGSWERFGALSPRAAIDQLEPLIHGGRDDALLWEELVRLDLARRRESDARAHQSEFARRHAGDPAAIRSSVRLALAEGRTDAAADALGELAGERADSESELLRAQLELARGDLAAAKAAAIRAAELAPGFSAPAERIRAEVHAAMNEWPEALAAIDRIAGRGLPLTADDSLIRVRALYARGDRAAAKQQLETLLAQPAPDAAVEFARSEGSADPARARAHLERAHRAAPAHFAVLEALTHLDLRTGEPARAIARIERVIAQQHTGARVLLLRAEVLAQLGQLARAEADALRALEAAPQLPRAVDLAYSIFAAEQKLDDAQRAFEAAEAAGALHGGARALLARIYLARGEAEKAQAIYQRVLAESPDIALAQLASLRPAGGVTQPRARPRSRRRRTRSAHLAPVRAPA